MEQVIPKWSDGICYPSIGGDKVELKYRNTPKPAQRHYKITPVRIGLEKHPPPVAVVFDHLEHLHKVTLASDGIISKSCALYLMSGNIIECLTR